MNRHKKAREYVEKQKECEKNNWNDPFYQDNQWYAFPPGAVIPKPYSCSRMEKDVFSRGFNHRKAFTYCFVVIYYLPNNFVLFSSLLTRLNRVG